MAGMLYLFAKVVYLYIAYPTIVREVIKVPPILPLIPYLPQAFKLSFLPPFYFIYWIVILAIIAITHEFAHGIFMRIYKIKIKSTGFGFFPFFLPVFLAAFVEQDEKSMNKATIFQQKAVLGAGTFANTITAILGFLVLVLFFSLAFTPSGVVFDNYAYGLVGIGSISTVNGINLDDKTHEGVLGLINEEGNNKIKTDEGDYVITKDFLNLQRQDQDYLFAYFDAPAINSGLNGAILNIEGFTITNLEKLTEELGKYSIGDTINIKTTEGDYQIVVEEHLDYPDRVWLGVSFSSQERRGGLGKVITAVTSFKKPYVYYESNFRGGNIIYDFLWWLVLISLSVALVNMLPMGIFDGGRFFYLTVLQITKSERKARAWFKHVTNFLLLLVLVLMVFWALSFI